MAAMFYSLQEVIEKLNKTEEQVKNLIKQGRLREFRDGSNLLFKVDEVEALLSDTTVMKFEPETEDIRLQPEQEEKIAAESGRQPDEESVELTEAKENKPALKDEAESLSEDDTNQLVAEDTSALPQLEPDDAILNDIMGDTQIAPEKTGAQEQGTAGDISLDDIMADTQAADELNASDTTAKQELSEEAILSDDLMGETKAASDTAGLEELMQESKAAAEELSLEEIEDDVSLDSFGSGSGLLDLSLQADDTSLGGILDEIYTPEGQEQATPDGGLETAHVPDDILGDQALTEPQLTPAMAAYVEPAPDSISNAIGLSLFLPLITIVYATIVVLAGSSKFIPSILGPVKGIIWYVLGGLTVLVMLIVGIAAMAGQSTGKPAKPKVKKEKKVKPKKEKQNKEKKKKEKKPKEKKSKK